MHTPPEISPPRRRSRILIAAAISVAAMLLCVYYFAVDPATDIMPRCIFKSLTGWNCPGCGSQRTFHALLHGNVAEAFGYNPAIFAMLPVAALYALAEWNIVPKLRSVLLNRAMLLSIAGAIIVWTVVRNIKGI